MSEIVNISGKKYSVKASEAPKSFSLNQSLDNHEKINNHLNHKLTSILKAACLGPAFLAVDTAVAKRNLSITTSENLFQIMKRRPFFGIPLPILYGMNCAATKAAEHAAKPLNSSGQRAQELKEAVVMFGVNNIGSQIVNRGIIRSIKLSGGQLPRIPKIMSVASALYLSRDFTLWTGTKLTKGVEGWERWGASAIIFSMTTGFHLSANLAAANEPVRNVFSLVQNRKIIPILGLRLIRIELARMLVEQC